MYAKAIIINKVKYNFNFIDNYVKLFLSNERGENMTDKIPAWLLELETEDIEFIKNFVIHSGSLKQIANLYDVSYPTVRLRLDRLIEKIKLHDEIENEGFIQFIKKLSIDDRISLEEAKLIIEKYKQERNDS